MTARLPLVYSPHYDVEDWDPSHRFTMSKFRLLYEHLRDEGLARPGQMAVPAAIGRSAIEAVHDLSYVEGFLSGAWPRTVSRRVGLPWSPELVRRTRTAIGGTLLSARLALRDGLACNLGGGTHHAAPARGAGFCIFNDLAVALTQMLAEGAIRQALIIDLDVHQGDGTALAFAHEPRVFTFSAHAARNFPFRKPPSDLDLALEDGLDDEGYLARIAELLPGLIERVQPDLILYDAGVDPHAEDRLGRLALTSQGLYRRDRLVLESCLAAGVPVATVIGGGYCDDPQRLARRHSLVVRAAHGLWEARQGQPPPPDPDWSRGF